ncbi:hypothetical protein GDO81_027590 [Engystomops pustulosus]|uniref:Uncharacterized protein n=1 Tax=Engystomops pustulosus TaxID=76066 RepID=A0AAV6YIB9_ENGPU|nr:hypothetical protein GDO81_027590 [Engystomops pustulosus]
MALPSAPPPYLHPWMYKNSPDPGPSGSFLLHAPLFDPQEAAARNRTRNARQFCIDKKKLTCEAFIRLRITVPGSPSPLGVSPPRIFHDYWEWKLCTYFLHCPGG